jgi:uncharacterized repeat protein (TIGR04138 family)
MTDESYSLYRIIQEDPRYCLEAYVFVRESLAYAADCMELDFYEELSSREHPAKAERHLTGQQLCEAIRQYATNQFGYMAKVVLKNWGIESTSCFGDIVYNMINAGIMKKSEHDRRSHFDDVYSFDEVFQNQFEFGESLAHRRS